MRYMANVPSIALMRNVVHVNTLDQVFATVDFYFPI